MKKLNNVSEALDIFEESARIHQQATEEGNYKLGNKQVDKIVEAVIYLRAENKIDVLRQFLNHDNIGVRTWAATHLLPFYEKDALATLTNIEKSKGVGAFTAQITIQEWKKGKLNFDYLSK